MACCPNVKRFIALLLGLVLAGGFFMTVVNRPIAADLPTAADAKLLRHVVMFKFKATSSAEDIQHVIAQFKALPSKIPAIAEFEFGTDNSPEGKADGFTHCFLLTFKSEKDREIYLPHPDHKAFGAALGPHLDKVLVFDYWTGK